MIIFYVTGDPKGRISDVADFDIKPTNNVVLNYVTSR